MNLLGYSVLLIIWRCCAAQEISCPKPEILHGSIGNEKVFRKSDTLDYTCDVGYKSEGRAPECTEHGWNPAPACTEIVCYYPVVENGEVLPKWDTFKEGDTIDLRCNSGYQAVYDQGAPSTCTKSGWVLPPRCKSIECDYPEIEGGKLNFWYYRIQHSRFFPMEKGQTIDYTCNDGFVTASGSYWGKITCTLHGWDPKPKCFQPEQCGQAPPIANGDVEGRRMETYNSGTYVVYKCQPYYTPEGSTRVNCLNGAWAALPLCLEPCTASSQEMAANNIKLKWTDEAKVYLQHGDWTEFSCISGDYVRYKSSIFRVKCNRGKLPYPKCIKRGSCVISQADMESKNIITERENTDVPNGESVSFTCKPGFYSIPGKDMKGKCIEETLNYPECSPCLIHREDMDKNNVVLHEKHKEVNYQSNATIEFKCKTGFFRTGPLLGTCFQGKIGYPLCLSERPCLLSKELIDENNLKFNATSGNIDYVENGKTITFSCKDQYRKHLSSSDLTQVCDEEIIAYPICVRKKAGPLV